MSDTAVDILFIKFLVKGNGCVEVMDELVCLFGKTSAPSF